VSQSWLVSLWNQTSTVLAVNYRGRKPVFRRVSVVSGVRPLSLYLVELLCQLATNSNLSSCNRLSE
jgi:hypothetical protein